MKGRPAQSKYIEKARRLIALATDRGASEEEARTAALKACKLIIEFKLRLFEEDGETGESDEGTIVRREKETVFVSPPDRSWTSQSPGEPPPQRHVPPGHPSSRARWQERGPHGSALDAEAPLPPSPPQWEAVFSNSRKSGKSEFVTPTSPPLRVPDPSRHCVVTLYKSFCSVCGAEIPVGTRAADRHKTSDRICFPCFQGGEGYPDEQLR